VVLVLVLVLLLLLLLLLAEFLDLRGDQVAIELGVGVFGIEFQAAVVMAQGVFPMSQRVGGGWGAFAQAVLGVGQVVVGAGEELRIGRKDG